MENNELLYEELIKLIHESDVETLKEALENYHNNDIAKVQPELSEEDQIKLEKALDKEELADVVSYIDDFEEQLIGYHPGDTVEVVVTFPEDYGNEELNGKEAVFVTTINGIYE